jgi:STE24 endopeptidase
MNDPAWVLPLAAVLLLSRWGAESILGHLNRKHVRAHASIPPESVVEVMDRETFDKSVQYTLAKSRLGAWEQAWRTMLVLALVSSGVLPRAYGAFVSEWGASGTAQAAFLFLFAVGLSIIDLPLDWYAQFHLEHKFGFNTTTPRLWWVDRLKGFLLAVLLGFPLLLLVVQLFQWTGEWWWLWAWAALLGFQTVMLVLAPVVILPLFNKFTPLPEGTLRDRLLGLARRTGFIARAIQVMDGSRRSRHSNAFFTGFGRFRKIVLFDTLVQQLEEVELEAVLAHEIGHFRLRHIPRMLAGSAIASVGGFYLLGRLAESEWFSRGFGFAPGQIAPVLLLFSLLAGGVSFWLVPLANWVSRHFEYQADAFAADAMKTSEPLVRALRKLNAKNLSNLTPHPWFSRFYYSHPTLIERERALRAMPVSAHRVMAGAT